MDSMPTKNRNNVDLKKHIEKWVVEISGGRSKIRSINPSQMKKVRKDETQDIILLYSNDMNSMKKIVSHFNPGEYYLRQANLEDLFMKITGRELNETQ